MVNPHQIKMINSTGFVTFIAGNGSAGSNDGPGSVSTFNQPNFLAVDQSGNIFVADYAVHKIRKINSTGYVSTYAGSGVRSTANGQGIEAQLNFPLGITLDGNSNIFFADRHSYRIRKINSTGYVSTVMGSGYGYKDGPVASALATTFGGLAIDPIGNIYFVDAENYRIRCLTSMGTIITIAGNWGMTSYDSVGTAASFYGPHD